MQIFVLDYNPKICAEHYCNKHVIKIPIEIAQMLSTAHHVLDGNLATKRINRIYKRTHENHPCSKWVRECRGNYAWAYALALNLLYEYSRRYDKPYQGLKVYPVLMSLHKMPCAIKAVDELDLEFYRSGDINLGANVLNQYWVTAFAQAIPDEYRNPCVVTAYRNFYIHEKYSMCSWYKKVGGVRSELSRPCWFPEIV